MNRTLKHIAIAGRLTVALAAGGALAACATTGGTSPTTTVTFAQIVQDAILACQGLCAIAPTAETLTSIILASIAGSGAAQVTEATATAAASAFCSGVTGKTTPAVTSLRRRATRLALASRAARSIIAAPVHRHPPIALGDGTYDYGTIVVNGRSVPLVGTPR